MTGSERLFTLPYTEILRLTSERTPYAGGGAVSAMACASAASLVVMAARFAGDAAASVVADAEAAMTELERLADADAEAFGELLRAWKLPSGSAHRRSEIATAASHASQVPLRVCEIGSRVAEHAAWLAHEGKRDLKGDALTAGYLAMAGVRGAAALVEINVRQTTDQTPAEEARNIVAHTARVIERMEGNPQ